MAQDNIFLRGQLEEYKQAFRWGAGPSCDVRLLYSA